MPVRVPLDGKMTTSHVRGLLAGEEARTVMEMEESSSTDTAWLSAVGPLLLPTPPQSISNRGRINSIRVTDFLTFALAVEIDSDLSDLKQRMGKKRQVHVSHHLIT